MWQEPFKNLLGYRLQKCVDSEECSGSFSILLFRGEEGSLKMRFRQGAQTTLDYQQGTFLRDKV